MSQRDYWSETGEKILEELITHADASNTIDIGDYYVILPTDGKLRNLYLKIIAELKQCQKILFMIHLNKKFLNIERLENY